MSVLEFCLGGKVTRLVPDVLHLARTKLMIESQMESARATCVVVTWFHETQPGFLDFSYRIRALSRHFATTIVSRAPLTQEELLAPEATYVVLDTKDSSKRSLTGYLLRVARLLWRLRPRVVVHLGSHTAAAVLLTPAQRSAVYWNEHPSHYLLHWPWKRNPIKALTNVVLRKATYLGAIKAQVAMPIGEAHLADLVVHGAIPDRLRLIYMGVDGVFRRNCGDVHYTVGREKEPLRLVYTGTVARERGRDVMLEGLALANQEEVRARLTIIGASPDQISYCRKRAEELGISEQLDVLPRISGNLIPSLLERADLGICIWEDRIYWRFNPPTKLFEYLVAGLPVLASDIRTHTQYVTDGLNGRIFKYSAVSFAEKVSDLWLRRSELPILRRNAAESGERYLWERIEPEFIRVVKSIA